jgi:uncharacterized protein
MSTPAPPAVPSPPLAAPLADQPTAPSRRILALDVVRGVAVAGILFVNAPPMLQTPGRVVDGQVNPVTQFLDMAVQQRFFPIFSLLFGIGFGLMWASARNRSPRPRIVMLRRLLFLLLLGIGHNLLQPGEALLPYAIFALLLLLPATFLPDTRGWNRTLVGLGVAGTVAAAFTFGGMLLVPTLLVTGWGLARTGAVARFTDSRRAPVVGAVGLLLLAAPLLWWQAQDPLSAGFTVSSAVAGLVLAGAYVCVVCALLPTPLGRPLAAFFAPLGRTALTTYVSATLVLLAVNTLPLVGGQTVEHALDLDDGTTGAWARLVTLCAALVVVQAAAAHLWLRAFRQGPLEWAWRSVTWWQVAPMRR